MYLKKNFKKSSGIYRTNDPIENFKFRVVLKKIDSLIKIPNFDLTGLINRNSDDKNDTADKIIKWQEKLFSLTELKLQDLKINESRRNSLLEHDNECNIFTYINSDDYVQQNQRRSNKMKLCEMDIEFDVMSVMVDIKSIETLLFTLQWSKIENLFIIYPDFNDITNNPYFLEIDSDSRDLYFYAIENVSTSLNLQEDENEFVMSQKLKNIDFGYNKQAQIRNNDEETNFKQPKTKFDTIVVLLHEIKLLENFEYSNCYVKYHIKLPLNYKLEDGDIEGSTHSSVYHKSGKWFIGHCHEMCILKDHKKFNFDSDDCDNLKIDYEVISIDFFGRKRIEGRAHVIIPMIAGFRNLTLNCYREIIQNKYYDNFQRFFWGGRFLFNSADYNGVNSKNSTTVNRYGNATKSTGKIEINCYIIKQHHPKSTFANANVHQIKHVSLDDIISSYSNARQLFEMKSGRNLSDLSSLLTK